MADFFERSLIVHEQLRGKSQCGRQNAHHDFGRPLVGLHARCREALRGDRRRSHARCWGDANHRRNESSRGAGTRQSDSRSNSRQDSAPCPGPQRCSASGRSGCASGKLKQHSSECWAIEMPAAREASVESSRNSSCRMLAKADTNASRCNESLGKQRFNNSHAKNAFLTLTDSSSALKLSRFPAGNGVQRRVALQGFSL